MFYFLFVYHCFLPCPFLFLLFTLVYLCGELSNPSSFCYGTIAVQDDAAPGTQEYIMLRQDSIHSADIRSKGSPFRAKCHEIFCCPLKQVVHKESSEPEGLFTPPPHFNTPQPLSSLSLLLWYGLISFSASRLSLSSLLLYWTVSAVFLPLPSLCVRLCNNVQACVCFSKLRAIP